MLLKLLGILDLICAGALLIQNYFFKLFPTKFIFILAFYLVIKGAIFLISLDFASILDILSGGIIILSVFFVLPKILIGAVIFYLIQKGVISLVI
jgi:hypothetical protein